MKLLWNPGSNPVRFWQKSSEIYYVRNALQYSTSYPFLKCKAVEKQSNSEWHGYDHVRLEKCWKFATAYDWMNKHISYLIYPLVPRNNWTLQIIAFQWRAHESYWLQLFDNTTLLWCSSAPGSITHFRLTAIRVMSPNFIGLASGSSASYLQLAILMRQFNFRISFGKNDKTPRAKLPLWAGRSKHGRSGWENSCTLEVSNAALEPCTIIIETQSKC